MKENPDKPTNTKSDKSDVKKEKPKKLKSLYFGIALAVVILIFFGIYSSLQSNLLQRQGTNQEIPKKEAIIEEPERLSPGQSKPEEIAEEPIKELEPKTSEEKDITAQKETPQEKTEFIIEISEGKFKPKVVSVKPGTTVRWVNNDNKPHKVAARDRSFYGTKIVPGESYSFIFNDPGSYEYFDVIFYRTMKGTIIVEDSKAFAITGSVTADIGTNKNSGLYKISALTFLLFLALIIIVRTSLSFAEKLHYNNKKKKRLL